MGIRTALGGLGLFLFEATAETRGPATLARPEPDGSTLAALDAPLPRLGTRLPQDAKSEEVSAASLPCSFIAQGA